MSEYDNLTVPVAALASAAANINNAVRLTPLRGGEIVVMARHVRTVAPYGPDEVERSGSEIVFDGGHVVLVRENVRSVLAAMGAVVK